MTWKIVIAPREWIKVNKADGEEVDGITIYSECTIYLCDDLIQERFTAALFHELCHAIFDQSGIDKQLEHMGGRKYTHQKSEEIIRALEAVGLPAFAVFGFKPRKPRA